MTGPRPRTTAPWCRGTIAPSSSTSFLPPMPNCRRAGPAVKGGLRPSLRDADAPLTAVPARLFIRPRGQEGGARAPPLHLPSASQLLIVVAAGLLVATGTGVASRIGLLDLYTTTTGLMQGGPWKQPLTACRLVPLSLPPPGCGGVEVGGVADPMRLPGARRLGNGVLETDTVRLVGTWDGHALNLTEPPRRATPHPSPLPVTAPATPRAVTAAQRLAADQPELRRQGILIMESAPDGDAVYVLVPVADDQT